MRTILPLVACLLVTACPGGPDPDRYGTLHVGIDCPEPTSGYVREAVPELDGLEGPAWKLDGTPDVTVRCGPTVTGAAGEHEIGTRVVRIDPTLFSGLFATKLVAQHELVHWAIGQGRHPDRATLHLCRLVNEMPTGCWSGRYGHALMNPSIGSGGMAGFDGAWAADLPDVDLTWMDGEFIRWGMDP